MPRIKTTIIAFAVAAICLASVPSEANADGPLRRWLRGLWKPNSACCNQPAGYGYQPLATPAVGTNVANYAPNPYNLQPGQCMKTCQQTCSRTVVNYVPHTAYRTVTNRVPVTQYRPETNSDPCTGCTVTCMKPCTTYTYQVQRVPYTTYRPVYRQETYKVPVTTITNDCATGNCATGTCATGCNTCGPTGYNPVMAPQNYAPTPVTQPNAPAPQTQQYYEPAPTISTDSNYGTNGGFSTPADTTPALRGVTPTSTQRPVIERLNQGYQASNSNQYEWSNAPARINVQETASRSPVRKQWSYSPVRLASYHEPVRSTPTATSPIRTETNSIRSTPQPTSWSDTKPVKRNSWVEVN